MNTTINKGVALALITAFISGFAVFLNKFAVSFWSNSSVFTTAKNLIATLFLFALLISFKKIKEIKSLSKNDWLKLLAIGLIGGSIPFLLFFKGLTMMPASNAAFIHKTLFIWVALLAVPFLKEKLSKIQCAALVVMFLSVFLLNTPKFRFGYGELLVFSATLFWAVENIIAKNALKNISPFTVAWARMFFGSLILIGFLIIQGSARDLIPPSSNHALWLLASGAILFGYVATWYSALKLAPASLVSAVLAVAAPITIALDAIFVNKTMPLKSILPSVLLVIGVTIFLKSFEGIRNILQKTSPLAKENNKL